MAALSIVLERSDDRVVVRAAAPQSALRVNRGAVRRRVIIGGNHVWQQVRQAVLRGRAPGTKASRQRRPDDPGEHRVCERHAADCTLTLLTESASGRGRRTKLN